MPDPSEVDDVFELNIPVVWAFAIPPADMVPHLLRRNARQSLIQRFDVQDRDLAELLQGLIGELDILTHGQVRQVDLQEESRLDDGLVFLLYGLSHRIQKRLFARVGLVHDVLGERLGGNGGENASAD